MARPMKWHILNGSGNPFCWDDEAMEFDTQESALKFLNSYIEGIGANRQEYFDTFGVSIQEGILYYDGGYINMTGKIVIMNEEDWSGELADAET